MKVPGSGLHIDSPAWPLLQALISYWGVTDANGNVGGTTIRCGALALEPSYANHALKILSGPAAGQIRDATIHPAGTDTVTVVEAFSNVAGAAQQITPGTLFVILSKTPAIAEVAALTALVQALMLDVGNASTSVLGSIWNILGDPAVDLATSIAAIAALLNAQLVLTEDSGTLLSTAAEQNVAADVAPAALFKPLTVKINLDNMLAGDTTIIRVFDRITAAGNLEQVDLQTYAGADGGLADGNKVIYVILKENRWGFAVTLQQTAGGFVNYDWEYLDEE